MQTLAAPVASVSVAVARGPHLKARRGGGERGIFFSLLFFFPPRYAVNDLQLVRYSTGMHEHTGKQARARLGLGPSLSARPGTRQPRVSSTHARWERITATPSNEEKRFNFVLACCNNFFTVFARRIRLDAARGRFCLTRCPRSCRDAVPARWLGGFTCIVAVLRLPVLAWAVVRGQGLETVN